MTELEALWAAYEEVLRQAKEVQAMITELGHQIAVEACPFKVGDVLTRTYMHGGYTRKRQKRIQRARVTGIRFCSYRRSEPYELLGINIRKDGTDGAQVVLWYHDNWTKEESE